MKSTAGNHPGVFVGSTFDMIFQELNRCVSESPQFVCSPRGQKVKEFLATTLVLTNPRARVIQNPARESNHGFAVGEFLWYWQGKRDLETMLYYNKRMKDFSNDGSTLNSAYGYRLRQRPFFAGLFEAPGTGGTQWETCVKTLLQDGDSRRAVMLINLPQDEREAVVVGSKDVPCTLSLQFFIRDGRLHLQTLMRSNDIIWGLTYDLFSFTLFQECMLLDLRKHEQFKDLELGTYYHTAGSLHVYERHFEQSEKIGRAKNFQHGTMEPIPSLHELDLLCKAEDELRSGRVKEIFGFAGGCRWMQDQLNAHRAKRDSGK